MSSARAQYSRRRHILFLTSWYPTPAYPSHNTFVRDHARAAALHHDVTVLHVPNPNEVLVPPYGFREITDADITAGVPTYTMRLPARSRDPLKYLRYVAGIRRAMQQLRHLTDRFDLVHAHTLDAGAAAGMLRPLLRVPLVLTEHFSGVALDDLTTGQRVKAHMAYRAADLVLPVSGHLAEAVRRLAPRTRIEIVPNVVDTSIFRPAERQQSSGTLRIVSVTRLHPVKRPYLLLDAAAALRDRDADFRLDIVGGGPIAKAVADRVATLGLQDQVTLHGTLAREEIAHRLRSADVFLLTSRTETFGLAALEALACGLPVVACHVGALSEIVTPQRGRLVAPAADALAEATLDVSEGSATDGGRRTSASIAEEYGVAAIGKRLDSVYSTLLGTDQ